MQLHTYWAALAAVVATSCVPSGDALVVSRSRESLARDVASKTVGLVDEDEDGRSFCSGVWVSQTSILTAKHCISDGKLSYVVRDNEASMRPARLYASDDSHDLALLRAGEAPAHAVASVSMSGIVPGAYVATVGHPRGLWYSFASGDVSAVRTVDGTMLVQATVPLNPGNSGGGLFNAHGELVGMADSVVRGAQGLSLFVHASHVDALLKLHRDAL